MLHSFKRSVPKQIIININNYYSNLHFPVPLLKIILFYSLYSLQTLAKRETLLESKCYFISKRILNNFILKMVSKTILNPKVQQAYF